MSAVWPASTRVIFDLARSYMTGYRHEAVRHQERLNCRYVGVTSDERGELCRQVVLERTIRRNHGTPPLLAPALGGCIQQRALRRSQIERLL